MFMKNSKQLKELLSPSLMGETKNIVTNLKDAYESNGQELINDLKKYITSHNR